MSHFPQCNDYAHTGQPKTGILNHVGNYPLAGFKIQVYYVTRVYGAGL
jgi:hypothetical protein